MKNYILLPVVMATLILQACSGCKQSTYPTYPITDQRLIDAATIKLGSYFVYLDSATNQEDSLGVDTFNPLADRFYQNAQAYYSTINYRAENANGEYVFTGAIQNALTGFINIDNHTYGHIAYCKLPYVIGTKDTSAVASYSYRNYYDNMVVHGKNYLNVYEVDQLTPTDTIRTWYSLSSGLVKLSTIYPEQHTWNLVRSYIVK